MSKAVELAQVWVPLMPEASRLAGGVDKIAADAERRFGRSGKVMGSHLAKGVDDGAARAVSSLRKVETASAALTRVRKSEADAAGRLRVAEVKLDELRTSGRAKASQLAAAEENVARTRRAHLVLAGQLKAKTTELSRAQDAHSAASLAAGGASKVLGANMSSAAGGMAVAARAAAAVGVATAGAAVAGVAMLGAGAVVAANRLYELGSAWDDASDSIRVRTGKSGRDLEMLNNAVKAVGRNVPASLGEVANIVGDLGRFLHVGGTDLDKVATSLANVAHMTGEAIDVKELGKAFRANGVQAGDMVGALDSMWRTSQATGLSMNELLASVVKGGPQLREFGFTLGQQAALLASLEDAGLDADKVTTTLTKALATFAKDGKKPQEALRGTITEIQRLISTGDEAGAQNLTNKVFGAKGGVQFFEAVKTGAIDLQTLDSAISGTGDTIAQAADDTYDWAEKWQEFKNKAEIALQPIGSAVFDGVNEGLGELADWTEAHQSDLIDFFTKLGEGAITASQFVLAGVADVAGGIGEFIAPIGDVMGAVNKFQAWQADLRGDHDVADELRAQAEGFFGWGEGLTEFSRKAKEFIGSGGDKLKSKLHELGQQAADSARLTTALGDATAALGDDNVSIMISDNSPEVIERLRLLGIQVEETPTGLKITANTAEGERILNAFRQQQGGDPIEVPTTVDTRGAASALDQWKAYVAGQSPVGVPVTPKPTTAGDLIMPQPRATGGLFAGAHRIAFAGGKLPTQALIQNPVMGGGLVQWAEPSTKGEAFIPLGGGKRSVRIWTETGRRLGVLGFDQGGIRSGPQSVEDVAGSLAGAPYVRGGHTASGVDCSGAASILVNAALGLPLYGDRMATGNAGEWLTARGAVLGDGPPGTLRVGWRNGGPGGGHMAVTLPDGRNAESGGSVGNFTVGAGAQGAADFPNQAYIPIEAMYPDGWPSGSGGASNWGGGGAAAGGGYGGGGSGGGGGAWAAQNRVATAEGEVREKQAKLDEVNANAKSTESQKIAAENDLAKAERDRDKAKADLVEAQKNPGGKSSGPDAAGFGQGLLKGALEGLGFDGETFSDPTQWGIFKTGAGLANIFGGVLKNWNWQGFAHATNGGRDLGLPLGHQMAGSRSSTVGDALPGSSDGGLGGFDFGSGGNSAGLDSLQAVLPNVGDFLPNSQSPGGGMFAPTSFGDIAAGFGDGGGASLSAAGATLKPQQRADDTAAATTTTNSHNTSNDVNFRGPVTMVNPSPALRPHPDRFNARAMSVPS